MDFVSIVFGAVDIPFIVGIVVIIEVAKRLIKLKPRELNVWYLVVLAMGFLAAFLKVEISTQGWRTFAVQGVVYAGAAIFVYQGYKTATAALKRKK
jgi:hypothetical protein